jgi:hypothetical protein
MQYVIAVFEHDREAAAAAATLAAHGVVAVLGPWVDGAGRRREGRSSSRPMTIPHRGGPPDDPTAPLVAAAGPLLIALNAFFVISEGRDGGRRQVPN